MTDRPQLPAYIDSTMISTFRSCRKKFYYTFVRNLQPPGKSVHLIAGGAFAAGLEAARNAAFVDGKEHLDDQIAAAYRGFSQSWGSNYPDDEEVDFFEHHAKNYVNTFSSLELYLSEFPILADPIQPQRFPDGKPTVEFSFALPLDPAEDSGYVLHPSTGAPFIYAGRFDMLGLWNGELPCILDEKTSSGLGEYWLQQWTLRSQFMGYSWACAQMGYPVHQAFIRGVAILKTRTNFLTAPVSYPEFLLQRWHDELKSSIRDIVACWESNTWSYNLGDACAAYGGCGFTSACQARDPEKWLSQFDERTWNPLEKSTA